MGTSTASRNWCLVWEKLFFPLQLKLICPITLPRLKPPEKGCHPVIVTHTKRDHVALSRRGTLIVLGEEDRRILSLRWWRSTRAFSRRELACHRLLKSSAPLLFPHRSLGRSLKRKLSVSAEKQDWNSRNESSQSRWAQRQHGISPSMTHTQRECHPRPGETCMSYNGGAAFATTSWNLPFCEARRIDAGWLQGMTEFASWLLREVLIRLLEAFQRLILASAKSQRRREFVAVKRRNLRSGGMQLFI